MLILSPAGVDTWQGNSASPSTSVHTTVEWAEIKTKNEHFIDFFKFKTKCEQFYDLNYLDERMMIQWIIRMTHFLRFSKGNYVHFPRIPNMCIAKRVLAWQTSISMLLFSFCRKQNGIIVITHPSLERKKNKQLP